jgi:hypothetical protein
LYKQFLAVFTKCGESAKKKMNHDGAKMFGVL